MIPMKRSSHEALSKGCEYRETTKSRIITDYVSTSLTQHRCRMDGPYHGDDHHPSGCYSRLLKSHCYRLIRPPTMMLEARSRSKAEARPQFGLGRMVLTMGRILSLRIVMLYAETILCGSDAWRNSLLLPGRILNLSVGAERRNESKVGAVHGHDAAAIGQFAARSNAVMTLSPTMRER
jgi:hypothetical protein